MFSRSTTARFDFKPTSITPGPGSYDVATSSLLHPRVSEGKKSAAFGDSKRWTDIEALITRSNPLLLHSHAAPPSADKKRARESLSTHLHSSRRTTMSAPKRQRSEEGGEEAAKDGGKEKAEWEVERQHHAETQRELLHKLKEIKEEWEGERSSLTAQLTSAQELLDSHQQRLDELNTERLQHTQHSDALQQQIEQLEAEKAALLSQVSTLTSNVASVTSDVEKCQATLKQVEERVVELDRELSTRSQELQEERSWRGELEQSLTRVQSEFTALEASNTSTVQSMRWMEERVEELKQRRLQLEQELQASGDLITTMEGELVAARAQVIAMQEEVVGQVEAVKRESAVALASVQDHLQRQREEQQRVCSEWEVQVSSLQGRNSELSAELQDAEQGRQAQSSVVASMKADSAIKVEEISRLRAEVVTLKEQQAAVRNELVTLYNHHTSVSVEMNEKTKDMQALQTQLDASQAALEVKEAALLDAQHSHQQLSHDCAALREEVHTHTATVSAQAADLQHSKAELAALSRTHSELHAQLSEMTAEKAGLEREISALEGQLERLASQSHTANDALKVVNDRVLSLEAQNTRWQTQSQELETDLHRVTSQLAASEMESRTRERRVEELMAECDDMRRGRERVEGEMRRCETEVVQMRQQVQGEGEWKAKFEESRELCLLLKAETERLQSVHHQQLQDARREEQRLTATVERVEKAANKDKERHLHALKEADERRLRDVAAERKKASVELTHLANEKAELNRSLSKEVAEFKRAATQANHSLMTAEGKLAQATANEVKLVQDRMKAERRVKELTQAMTEKERELASITSTVTAALIKSQVTPLQHSVARLTAELTSAQVQVTALQACDAQQKVVEMKGRHDDLIAQLDALTTQYEQCRAMLQSSTHRQAELDQLMEGAEHQNPHQRIHLHALIKEENRLIKAENEGMRRELVRHKRELRKMGVTLEEEGTDSEEGKTAGEVGLGAGVGKENPLEGKRGKRSGPRHRSVLSSVN